MKPNKMKPNKMKPNKMIYDIKAITNIIYTIEKNVVYRISTKFK